MLVEDDYITTEIQGTERIGVNTTTKNDDMFITSYDIELGKANKKFYALTTTYFLNCNNALQIVLLIQN